MPGPIECHREAPEDVIKKLLSSLLALSAIAGAAALGWVLATPSVKLGAGMFVQSITGPQPDLIIINTTRHGLHHALEATITGPNRQPQVVSFIVDTGASEVVLPMSVMQRLGFRPLDLRDAELQTVNGRVTAKRGVLHSLAIGQPGNQDVIENVSAVFMDDASTAGFAFLGMNILGRYGITIDEDQNQILLKRRVRSPL